MNSFSSFLRKFEKENNLRLFMPGHQGKCSFLNKNISAVFDLTEIKGADSLYNSKGIIKNLEDFISKIYCSNSYISAGGSTLCIQTILWILKNKKFIASRGAHMSFYNAAALFGIHTTFIGNHRTVRLKEIKNAFLKVGKGAVLFLTSPNYYGEVLDIKNIRQICDLFEATLVVDAAHGAHLRFLNKNLHPIFLGADFCCCSFHKTLPALTGASILFVREGILDKDKVKKTMALFGSSSPSYLIIDSIGLCADWLQKHAKREFSKLNNKKQKLISALNLKFLKTDPTKLVLDCFEIKGGVLAAVSKLRKFKIVPEFYNNRFICLILSPFLKDEDWVRVKNCLKELKLTKKSKYFVEEKLNFKKACGLKTAMFKKKEYVNVKHCLNRVFADNIFSQIPGVLLLAYGEILTEKFVKILKEKGIEKVRVLK